MKINLQRQEISCNYAEFEQSAQNRTAKVQLIVYKTNSEYGILGRLHKKETDDIQQSLLRGKKQNLDFFYLQIA